MARRRVWGAGIAVLAAALAGVAAWQAGRTPADGVDADPDNPALVATGRSVYERHCASCHGGRLEGQPDWRERRPDGKLPAPPHDATGHSWHHPDALLVAMTRDGVAAYAPPGYQSDMPAFRDTLSDREIVAVIAFIKSNWPADIRQRQARITAQQRQETTR